MEEDVMDVTISREEYRELVRKEAELDLIEKFLFYEPELNYRGDKLEPNRDMMDIMYKALYPTRTKAMISHLKEEEGKKHE
jgi:hypothetical protein